VVIVPTGAIAAIRNPTTSIIRRPWPIMATSFAGLPRHLRYLCQALDRGNFSNSSGAIRLAGHSALSKAEDCPTSRPSLAIERRPRIHHSAVGDEVDQVIE
jgi:hypothetical protein